MKPSTGHQPKKPTSLSREFYFPDTPESQQNGLRDAKSASNPPKAGSTHLNEGQTCSRNSKQQASPNPDPQTTLQSPITKGSKFVNAGFRDMYRKLHKGETPSGLNKDSLWRTNENNLTNFESYVLTWQEPEESDTSARNEAQCEEAVMGEEAKGIADQYKEDDRTRIEIGDEVFEMTRDAMREMVWDVAQLRHFEEM